MIGSDLIRNRDARPLDRAQTILAWPIETVSTLDGGTVVVAGAGYLLRSPVSNQKALISRSTILRAVGETEVPTEGIKIMNLLCDAIVASVRWKTNA